MGKKVAVLGLGPSLAEFKTKEFDLSIGVNDIWSRVHADIVVCLDKRQNFTRERMHTIDNCKPRIFYSQMATYNTRPDFRKIEIHDSYPEVTCDLGGYKFQRSFSSPFVAVQIAFRWYDTKEIHLFGVDLTNHPNLNADICQKIRGHFINLKRAMLEYDCHLIVHGQGILIDI